jgi:pimeloyl-ACP methyl ester carboxylesterase
MRFTTLLITAALGLLAAAPGQAAETRPGLTPCRLPGLQNEAYCGVVRRPLDPAAPGGTQIDVHYAVLPALARNRRPDPVFFFAGGPGQSAIDLGPTWPGCWSRVSNRRDVVLVDQRGTGRSAPLKCDEPAPTLPLVEAVSNQGLTARLQACRGQLQKLPHGDLRHYTTWVAMQDAEAVRVALGAEQVNVIGGSYGTRAVLDYMRQFPKAVRRAVIDGVAPPDMVLPASFSTDNQAALDSLIDACAADKACAARYPTLRSDWQALLASLPREVSVAHPVTGQVERLTLNRFTVLHLMRGPLYVPALASVLPLGRDRGGARPLRAPDGPEHGAHRRAPHADGRRHALLGRLRRRPAAPAAGHRPPGRRLWRHGRGPCTARCVKAGRVARCRRRFTRCPPRRRPRWCCRAVPTP